VELTDSYAGTGKVGLIGLAFTDRPASIATQALQFSSHAPGTVFASSDAAGTLEFEPAPATPATIVEAIKSGFASIGARFGTPAEPEKKPVPLAANDNDFAAFATAIGDQVATAVASAVAPANDAIAAIRTDFAALHTKLEQTEAPGFSRAPAAGGAGGIVTDC
jgi:hypothetical protein